MPVDLPEKSVFLKRYMSSHSDTLVGYAKWYGKVGEPITSAEMSAIDTKSMTLTCTLKNGSKKEVVVAIDPPFAGYDDVKPRLLEMKALSQEGLGMIKSPQIKQFHWPPRGYTFNIISYIVIFSGAFVASNSNSPLSSAAHFLHSYVSQRAFKIVLAVVVGSHVLESSYTLSLCWKYRASFPTMAAYFGATMFLGLHTPRDLRKRIQDARINSVTKFE
ncbi:hypothetical protein B0H15DRAFT_849664 [Mycena belliarum]|uniref:DUF2470 domain-containing protein n=1 Tax=Mycena belliarum TaxID=1033014 RepID=A0AAD6U0H5_9AGAR|nr:hypothetical protein B0H15DRAFT_849664 [Mycena belliae]